VFQKGFKIWVLGFAFYAGPNLRFWLFQNRSILKLVSALPMSMLNFLETSSISALSVLLPGCNADNSFGSTYVEGKQTNIKFIR